MANGEVKVFVLQSDASAGKAVVDLVQSMEFEAELIATPERLFELAPRQQLGCLVVGLRLPGMTGLEVQRELKRQELTLPVIFLTTYPDVASAVAAMKAGAVDYLELPFRPHELWASIQEAIRRSRVAAEEQRQWIQIGEGMQRLTVGERQVFDMLVKAESKTAIAKQLGLSTRTIEVRRAKLMRKLHTTTLTDLIRIAVRIEMRSSSMHAAGADVIPR